LEIGNLPAAIENFKTAIALYESVARIDRSNLSAQRQISFTRRKLGDAFLKSKNTAKANQIFETALSESESVNQKDPQNSEFRHDKALCLIRLAELNLRDKPKAESNLNQAIQILEKLTAESPEHRKRQADLEYARNLLAKLG
jgi:tetratricopeptide (TPR) repeat protein